MNPQTPYGWFRDFCKHNGFRFCDIHSLRHLHASLLINAGIYVVAVSGDMGHSVVGTTLNLYSHMFQEARIRNCDAITEMLHGEEERAYGDSGYAGASKRPEAIKKNKNGKRIKYITDAHPQSRSYQKAVNMPQRKENIRNHLSVVK